MDLLKEFKRALSEIKAESNIWQPFGKPNYCQI